MFLRPVEKIVIPTKGVSKVKANFLMFDLFKQKDPDKAI